MKYLLLLLDDDTPLAKLSIDEDERVRVDYLTSNYRWDLERLIDDLTEAGVTFTSEDAPQSSSDRHATNMVSHFMGDPDYFEGMIDGLLMGPPVIIDGHQVTARIVSE